MSGWDCVTCPATKPANNEACTDQGAQCTYGTSSCSCFGGTWHCWG
jgi:hypothetical protein